jgi:beta-lactamase class A
VRNVRFLLVLGVLILSGESNWLSSQTPENPSDKSSVRPGAEKQHLLWQKMKATIAEVDRQLAGVLGVAVLDLTDGKQFLFHGDEVFPQASSIKITVLAELYRQTQEGKEGKARLNDLYTFRAEDLVADSDVLSVLTPGVSRLTNRDLAGVMVCVSDNSATNVLIDRVGMDNVNAMLDRQGLKETRLRRKMMDLQAARQGRENVSTPREMMTLLEQIYRGKLFNKELTDDFFNLLSTHKESCILQGLPEGVRSANKPGALEGVRNDSGVVFVPNRPFVLCVMTTYLKNEKDGEAAIRIVTSSVHSYFDRVARASSYGRVISPANSGTSSSK